LTRDAARCFCAVVLPAALAASAPAAARAQGLDLAVAGGHLRVEFCAVDVVRVAFARDPAFFDRDSLAAGVRRCEPVRVERADAKGRATLSTTVLRVEVNPRSGDVAFVDPAAGVVLAEKPGGRVLAPAEVQGERTFHVRQEWRENDGEALYGLGQHQLGLLNVKGHDLDLWQSNSTVAVPFLVSSRGYGILWDNTSCTRFGDLRPWGAIPPAQLLDAGGRRGGLTGAYHSGDRF
jgi:alpha-D-xyloside xylohydrolase